MTFMYTNYIELRLSIEMKTLDQVLLLSRWGAVTWEVGHLSEYFLRLVRNLAKPRRSIMK